MEINYTFVPEFKTAEEKQKKDIMSYAGRLLELSGVRTMIISLDNDNVPFIFETSDRLTNAMDFEVTEY